MLIQVYNQKKFGYRNEEAIRSAGDTRNSLRLFDAINGFYINRWKKIVVDKREMLILLEIRWRKKNDKKFVSFFVFWNKEKDL